MEFKLTINDGPKSYKKELTSEESTKFIGLRIGESINGELIGLTGYELIINGGSDKCGFPMTKGVKGGERARVLRKGKRKTYVGNTISEDTAQINLKVLKKGKKSLKEIFEAPKEEAPKEE